MAAWDGVRRRLPDIFDDALGLKDIGTRSPHFQHKSACLKLDKGRPHGFSARGMIAKALERVRENFAKALVRRSKTRQAELPGSQQNWRWKPQCRISEKNTSKEIVLERAVAKAGWPGWTNQIPVASGVMSPTAGRTAVDLARRRSDGGIDLIELKWASDTPLYAALEILAYGLILVVYRTFHKELQHAPESKFFTARRIGLRVYAPAKFYNSHSLGWLEHDVNKLLGEVVPNPKMDFAFKAFPASFKKVPFESGKDLKDAALFNMWKPLLRKAFDEVAAPPWSGR